MRQRGQLRVWATSSARRRRLPLVYLGSASCWPQKSGLLVVGDILEGVEGVEFVSFGGEDVVRHKLVQRIVAAYAEHAERSAPELRPADRRRGA